MALHYNRHREKEIRQYLRNNATEAEQKLWQFLKHSQLGGLKFRRQYSVDQFVIDFFCASKRLGIELDGEYHLAKGQQDYDNSRQEHLESFGIKIIRFKNEQVEKDISSVLE